MNKYEVISVIGEGAYGLVLKGKVKATDKLVAIKKLKDADQNGSVKTEHLHELKLLRQLRQENIVELHEAFRRKGKLYLVFEYIEKNLLHILQERNQGLPQETVRRYMYHLCKAIFWCHLHDIIHRDIKPENLLVTADDTLKLCDFGFARSSVDVHSTDGSPDVVATRWYRSPELLVGCSHGKEVDVWSAGCLIPELSDGRPLFPGESDYDQLCVIQHRLGPLLDKHRRSFYSNPRFAGFTFPVTTSFNSVERRYSKSISRAMLDLLKRMLELDAYERYAIGQCLQHKAFLLEVALDRNPLSESSRRVNGSSSLHVDSLIQSADSMESLCPQDNTLRPTISRQFTFETKSNTSTTSFSGGGRSTSLIQETINNFWCKSGSQSSVDVSTTEKTSPCKKKVLRASTANCFSSPPPTPTEGPPDSPDAIPFADDDQSSLKENKLSSRSGSESSLASSPPLPTYKPTAFPKSTSENVQLRPHLLSSLAIRGFPVPKKFTFRQSVSLDQRESSSCSSDSDSDVSLRSSTGKGRGRRVVSTYNDAHLSCVPEETIYSQSVPIFTKPPPSVANGASAKPRITFLSVASMDDISQPSTTGTKGESLLLARKALTKSLETLVKKDRIASKLSRTSSFVRQLSIKKPSKKKSPLTRRASAQDPECNEFT